MPLKELKRTIPKAQENELLSKLDKIVESIDKGLKSRRGGSFRGLEKLVVEGYVEMTRRRHRCIDAVMDEQERQWNNLTSNLERIAEFSFVNSQKLPPTVLP